MATRPAEDSELSNDRPWKGRSMGRCEPFGVRMVYWMHDHRRVLQPTVDLDGLGVRYWTVYFVAGPNDDSCDALRRNRHRT